MYRGTDLVARRRHRPLARAPESRDRRRALKAVLDEAAEADKTVRLRVESLNRAVRLYERLGFASIGTDGAHIEMEYVPWSPNEGHSF